MAQKDTSSELYNASGGTFQVGGKASAYNRTSKGYTIPSNPETRSLGLAGKAVRPKDVVKSMGRDVADKMRETGEAAGSTTKMASPKSFKRGGLVKKSGMAMLHKGERVLNRQQAKKWGK